MLNGSFVCEDQIFAIVTKLNHVIMAKMRIKFPPPAN